MEKSMIQDLDNMRTSVGYKNTFTTSFHDGGYELRKSKISNLPSHKKSDLSVKLPFVVVFQTMEIQRLSEEIQALRVALKDSERQAFNCQSYQVQIRELTDQCHQYDVELLEYKEEIEKLNMISQKLYEQLEDWKQKYQNFDPLVIQKFNAKLQQCQNLQSQVGKWKDRCRALQKSKDKELQDLKLAMESQRKSVLDRQIKQLNIKFDTQRGYLQGQIKKLQQAAEQRDDEITRIKFESQALRIENEVNLDAGRKLKQSQNKMNKLTQQLVRINELLRRKQEQLDRKDANQDYLKELIKTLEREKINHQNQAIKVPQLEGAIKQWMVRFSRLQNESNENKEQLQKVPIIERDLQNCTVEIQRLGMVIKGKMHQLNQANNKSQKYKSLYEQSKKSEQKVPSLERKINQMNYEGERLNDILKKRLIQLQEAKARITALQKALRTYQQAEPEKKRIQQDYKRLLRQMERFKKQISDLQKQLRKIPELQAVLADERNIRQQYTRQVDRLNRFVKDKTEQIEVLNQKIYYLTNKIAQFENIQSEINNYKSQNNRMVQQIDNMNSRIKQKCQQMDRVSQVVQRLQKNLQQYKVVQQKLIENIENTQKIVQELNHTKSELQNTEQNLLQCENELSQAKNTIIDINNDKQMLSRNLNIKTQQLEHAKVEINQCLQQIQHLKQIQRLYHTLQQEMRVTEIKLKETSQLLKKQRAKTEQLEYKNQLLYGELERIRINGFFPQQFRMAYVNLKQNANQKDKEIENLLKKQIAMQKSVDQIQGMIFTVCETMKVRNSEWNQINQKIVDVANNVQKMQKLQDQINQLRVDNLQLQCQIKMLNLEVLQAQAKKVSQSTASSSPLSITGPISGKTVPGQTGVSSSWSFNSVPSKKAIDPIVQDQTASRISKILGSSNALNLNPMSTSKSKIDQARFSSRVSSSNENLKLNHINTMSNYQFTLSGNPSTVSMTSSQGVLPNTVSGYASPGKTYGNNLSKQSAQTYYTSKLTKTNSITEPFTFKTSFRG